MVQSGRANFVVVAAVVSLLAVFVLLLTAGGSPTSAANNFMRALAEQNAEKLAELSVLNDDDLATRRAKWEKTLDRGRHYIFTYSMDSATQTSSDRATVRLRVAGNANQAGSVDEKFELQMKRVDGEWKVIVPEINRRLFPSLPR